MQHGYPYPASKCEVKFKNLKQKYIKTVDHNNKSGNEMKTCSFFDELNEIFACNPSVLPPAECSNRNGYENATDKEETNLKKTQSPGDKYECPSTSSPNPKAVKGKKQKPLKPTKRKLSVAESLHMIQEDMRGENENMRGENESRMKKMVRSTKRK